MSLLSRYPIQHRTKKATVVRCCGGLGYKLQPTSKVSKQRRKLYKIHRMKDGKRMMMMLSDHKLGHLIARNKGNQCNDAIPTF